MPITLDEQYAARCLAAFIERDQLRDQVAEARRELAEIKAELAKLATPEESAPTTAPAPADA